jgi:hypothetical protein
MSQVFRRPAASWLLLLLVLAGRAVQPLFAAEAASHIRVVDDRLRPLIAQGVDGSATFRSLVARLESTPLLVFVRCQPRQQPGPSAAGLTFLTSAGGYRFVRIFIRCELAPVVQVPLLAHEFQHALEVAESTVIDAATMRSHYEETGYRSGTDNRHPSFETEAAIRTQRQVTLELARKQRPHVMAAQNIPALNRNDPSSRRSR